MKPLVLTLRRRLPTWLDLSPLTPERLDGLGVRSIRALVLNCGRDRPAVGDLFDVAGEDTAHLELRRCSSLCTGIGAGMNGGIIEVRGHGGQFLGRDMRGGRINLRGDAGDGAATGMSGGEIVISGSAGNRVGGPGPGRLHGMSGGSVTIRGDAGDRAGDHMRRGTILVMGTAGNYAGSRMVAGTLIILGKSGRNTGMGMRRGTIVLGRKPGHLPATFRSCGTLKMEFLRLLFKQIAARDSQLAFFRRFGPEAVRFAGDTAAGGQGEVLLLLNAAPGN